MKRRTRKALAVMFGEVPPAELHNVDIASFYPTERYIQKLVLGIEPIQAGTGDPSPYNVRPITGYTGVNVYVSPTQDVQDATVYPISWQNDAGTVYGGTLDVTSGVLTVTHKYVEPPKENVRRNSSYQWYIIQDTEIACGTDLPCISNMFRQWNGTESLYKHEYMCFQNSSGAIRFNSSGDYATVDDIWAVVGGMYFICQLATPLTYQLTPQQIATLRPGINNVWCDTGPVIELIS